MDFLDSQGRRENPVTMESRGQWDHQGKEENQAHQACRESENLDWMVCRDNQGLLAGKDNQVRMVYQGVRVYQVMASQGFLAQKVTRVMLVFLDFQDQKVRKVTEAFQGSLAPRGPLDHLAHQVKWDPLEVLASQGQKGKVVRGVRKDCQEEKVNQGPRDCQDSKVYPDRADNRDTEVCPGPWALKVNPATRAYLASQVLQDYLGPEAREDSLERKVTRESRGFQGLRDQAGRLVLPGFQDQKAKLVRPVNLAIPARENQDFRVILVLRESLAPAAPLAFLDNQANPVLPGLRDPLLWLLTSGRSSR